MFGSLGIQELFVLMLIIAFLSLTGMWPMIIRGLRELRGEQLPPECSDSDIDICYKLFGCSPTAPWEEIEKAYRKKAKLHHPDHGGDGDQMRALNDAYRLIKKNRGR